MVYLGYFGLDEGSLREFPNQKILNLALQHRTIITFELSPIKCPLLPYQTISYINNFFHAKMIVTK